MAIERAPESLPEAVQYFADGDVALAFVAGLRWPDGPTCPVCATKEPSYLSTRRIWKCRSCKKQFSVKLGTILEDSPISLSRWLPAIWVLANGRHGISSYELARTLGVTQKTAWFMLRRIQLATQVDAFGTARGSRQGIQTWSRLESSASKRAQASRASDTDDRDAGPSSLDRLREWTRRILQVPKSEIAGRR